MHDRALDAADVLNDLIGELVTGTNVFREYEALERAGKLNHLLLSGVGKMCLSYLVVSCCKLIEIYEKYKAVFKEPHAGELKGLMKEMRARGIPDFRNKVVGHIWDNDKKRILKNSEILIMLNSVMKGSSSEFLDWLNPLIAVRAGTSVVEIIEAARNALVNEYQFEPDQIVNR